MLISDRKQFIFIHITKTAGTSIRAALQPYSIDTPTDKWHSFLRRFDLPKDYRRFKFPRHAFLSAADKKIPNDLYQSYFKFAVVRNPWDRLVSSYHSDYGLKKERNPNRKYQQPVSFYDYLCKQRQRKNFQLERIVNLEGDIDLDFMLRFEQLNSDIEALGNQIGVDIELPHRNHSLRKKNRYQDYYDQQSKEYVGKFWREEIELLGYQFD
ncbi:MAG: sulfotransferase family protein [Acidiferrobacterales bacterium]|nr:sulfotransferase family protein [Acidiferrobacterales bacterium]